MTVQTIGTQIKLPIGKPFDLEIILVETGIFDLAKGLIQSSLLACSAQYSSG